MQRTHLTSFHSRFLKHSHAPELARSVALGGSILTQSPWLSTCRSTASPSPELAGGQGSPRVRKLAACNPSCSTPKTNLQEQSASSIVVQQYCDSHLQTKRVRKRMSKGQNQPNQVTQNTQDAHKGAPSVMMPDLVTLVLMLILLRTVFILISLHIMSNTMPARQRWPAHPLQNCNTI